MHPDVHHVNQSRFDRMAAKWDANPVRVALARAVADAIRSAIPLKPDMNAMDFGAGTGLVTLALLPYVGRLTAVDASVEMLRMLEAKLRALHIENVEAVLGEIGNIPLPAEGFDLIVSSMVLHHLDDVRSAIRHLRACLRPGGRIALADLAPEDGSFHSDMAGVFHHGLDPAQVCAWLKEAGFSDVSDGEIYRVTKPSASGEIRDYPVFLATGRV